MHLTTFIPEDRRAALAAGRVLPARAVGSVLAVDISGFTPLTEALVQARGERAGADAATRHLNAIYGELTAVINRWGGSVVGFSGDGLLCWFDAPCAEASAAAALAAAVTVQASMPRLAQVTVSADRAVTLAVKTAVATGPVTRVVVGDPARQRMDVLAGGTVDRAALAEQAAGQGEIVVDAPTFRHVRPWLATVARVDAAATPLYRVTVATALDTAITPRPLPVARELAREDGASWLVPEVRSQLAHAGGRFVGEIRPAVALFARFGDLDFDADPQAPAKLDAYVRWVQGVLARYDGVLIQLTTGDKGSYLYAAFGAPVAHDDDIGRAVHTARQLLAPPATLAYRPVPQIGLAHGRMRVGPYGSATRRTYGVQGAAVNLAARLMMQAEPGAIVVEAATATLLGARVALTPLPPVTLKGHIAPSTLYRLGPVHATPAPRSPVAGGHALIGREQELIQLRETLAAVCATGHGALVTVTGAAGMGKSLLLDAWLAAPGCDVRVAAGGGQSTERRTAYFGMRPLLRTLLDVDADVDPSAATDALIAHVAALDPAWTVRVPLLADLLDVPIPDNATTAAMDARLRREALHDLVAGIVVARAQRTPLVLAVDDVQWLDEASWALLEALTPALVDAPVLLALASRDGDGVSDPAATPGGREAQRVDIKLGGLEQGDMATLVAGVLAGPVDATAVALVQQRSQGNPFMAVAVIDALRRAGHLARDVGGDWALTPAVQDLLRRAGALVATADGEELRETDGDMGLNLPASLHGLVLIQLDTLSDPAKLTLKTAGVLGRTCARDVLAAVHPLHVDAPALARDLAELVARGILQPEDAGGAQIAFCHNITQEVVYHTLLEEQRRELHGRAATVLEQADPAAVAQLAHHFYHADLRDDTLRAQALHYLDLAAAQAQRDYANETALHQVDRALGLAVDWTRLKRRVDLLHLLGQREEEAAALAQLAACADAPVQTVGLTQGDYYEAISRYDDAMAAVTRARQAAASTADRTAEARCLARLGMIRWRQGDYAGAATHYHAALEILQGAADHAAEADTRYGLGLVHRQQGQYAAAASEFDRCLDLYRAQGNRPAEAKTLIALGHVAHYRHELDGAMDAYEAALAIYRETGDRAGVAHSLLSLGQVARSQGDYARSQRFLEQTLMYYRRLNDVWFEISVLLELSIVGMMLGDLADARRYLEECVAKSMEIHDESGVAYSACNLGQVLRDLGEFAEGQTYLQRSIRLAQEQKDRFLEASCLQDLARLHCDSGDYRAALTVASESILIFDDLQLPDHNVTNETTKALAYSHLRQTESMHLAVSRTLALLAQGAGEVVAFPQREYWICARLLQNQDRVAFKDCLVQAHTWMMKLANRISDPGARQAYLTNHAFNREIAAHFER
ncbi:MAG: tetratricopeptide repeat protein [Caldilineaceae bacterium]|nr:tetratricopeptide repeat protein [Caldilineaceae bacterium]